MSALHLGFLSLSYSIHARLSLPSSFLLSGSEENWNPEEEGKKSHLWRMGKV